MFVMPGEKYDQKEEIATGSFAFVNRCIEKATGREYAVKWCGLIGWIMHSRFEKVTILRKLKHPNIIQLHDILEDGGLRYVVFEYANEGELLKHIAKRRSYSEANASFYMRQILEAVNYCHQNGIVLRDVKPSDILLVVEGKSVTIKLSNFGSALEIKGEQQEWSKPDFTGLYFQLSGKPDMWHELEGTRLFVSPEMLKREPYGKPVDMWACGVILYILIDGSLPFYIANLPFDCGNMSFRNKVEIHRRLFEKIVTGQCNFSSSQWLNVSPAAKDLISRMLKVDQRERITAAEALTHKWISDRENFASTIHLPETVKRLKEFPECDDRFHDLSEMCEANYDFQKHK